MSLVWPRLKFFSELTRVQSSSTRLHLPVLVYLCSYAGCSYASLPTITYVSLTHWNTFSNFHFPSRGEAFRSFQPLATPCRTLHSIQDIAFPRVVEHRSFPRVFSANRRNEKSVCIIFRTKICKLNRNEFG